MSHPTRLPSWLHTRTGRVFSEGMASGFLCVTGAWDLELGLDPGPHDGVERVGVDLPMEGLLDLLP